MADVSEATLLAAALTTVEPELAVREGTAFGRRLTRPAGGLVPPADGGPWQLEMTRQGTLDGLALVACPRAAGPLQAGQVRVAVRAAGVTIRDLRITQDASPGAELLGSEVSGIVVETGPGVAGLSAGDRVLGLAAGGFGPLVVTDHRLLARIPAGWSFATAAGVPAAFTAAWHALDDLAAARPGQRLLVHAAAGGPGMAAVSIGRYLGLEVYGTAGPASGARWSRWAWTTRTSRHRGPGRWRTSSWRSAAGRAWTSCWTRRAGN